MIAIRVIEIELYSIPLTVEYCYDDDQVSVQSITARDSEIDIQPFIDGTEAIGAIENMIQQHDEDERGAALYELAAFDSLAEYEPWPSSAQGVWS